ncbi:glycosyltransferase family 4 protein [Mucilaginibacter sp. 14171R-50]|uniref:glycosyltransferase family 4 protein n=1 Tax=Mucilaginibacter sp. 14171R-50 TaxID=2703789 RepID=UPI00138CE907|nr:glycosyltransferase family 4 protein [Mucilaginibacter sp. 14171R-50]QHS56330.1 glycosyltransferase family 4 protein [Mucilaginibacter sp. 14171R-50]
MKRLAIITTHPIQYYAPVFRLLHQRGNISVKVFYTWGDGAMQKHDPGFNRIIEWDIPLLDGYPYEWVVNTSTDPGSHHFKGIINPALNSQVAAWQPDALLVFGWAYSSHLGVMRHFKNKLPVYFRGDSTLLDERSGLKSAIRSLFLKWVYKHADHAFYVGTNNRRYFEAYGFELSRLTFAPHAVDNERFADNRTAGALKLRHDLGIDADDILVLFAGKLEEKKSPGLLLNAFLNLPPGNVHLLFAGSGNLKQYLEDKAFGNKHVHFIDFQNQQQMPVIYQACNLFCLPSKGPGETWGLAVNEAMAGGKAVLVADKVGCAIDLVKPGYNGYIFKSGDENSLLTCLTELTRSKKILEKFGENSGKIIADWNFKKIAEAIENKLTE